MVNAILLPCFNEAERLQTEVIYRFAQTHDDLHLWLANDGSTDSTLEKITTLAQRIPERIFVLSYEKNEGKAATVRKAMMEIQQKDVYEWIGFMDADLSAPLGEFCRLLEEARKKQLLIAAGARVMLTGKVISRNIWRHYLSRIFTTYYANVLGLRNYDTQCGLKLFHKSVIPILFAKQFMTQWLFDIEIFLRAKNYLGSVQYPKKVNEIPLNKWEEIKGSKLKPIHFLKAPFEILKIKKAYRQKEVETTFSKNGF